MAEPTDPQDDAPPAVAVIGMAARFPGADDVDAFWDNLAAGRESIRPVSDEEFLAAGGDPADLDDPSLVRMASVVEGIDRFDAGFFGYSPAEAAVVDPQQRLLLETAYHALEDAGRPDRFAAGMTGVYAGAGDSRYYPAHVHPRFAGQPGSVELVRTVSSSPRRWGGCGPRAWTRRCPRWPARPRRGGSRCPATPRTAAALDRRPGRPYRAGDGRGARGVRRRARPDWRPGPG
ncbi:hypothetical protein STENM223S_10752 [Streptomyces tendae]